MLSCKLKCRTSSSIATYFRLSLKRNLIMLAANVICLLMTSENVSVSAVKEDRTSFHSASFRHLNGFQSVS